MSQVGLIVLIFIIAVVGVAVYFGIHSTAPSSLNATSTSSGFVSILRMDYLSRSPSVTPIRSRGSAPVYETKSQPVYRIPPTQSELVKRREVNPDAITTPASLKNVIPPLGFSTEDLSPFYGKVVVSSIGQARSYAGVTSLQLTARLRGSEKLSITDWHIRVGNADIVIPSAVSVYDPKYPQSGDIFLQSGHRVLMYGHYIYGYRHPFGKNLRLNACTGYLNNLYEFNPKLPKRCPRIDRDDVFNLSGKCQSFLTSRSACYEPTNEDANNFVGDLSCQAYMKDSVGYANCFSLHQNDADFLSGEWYVWLDKQIPFDDEHGRVLLYDEGGKLVDVYAY